MVRLLEWDNMRLKVDGRQLHHLRSADDVAPITSGTSCGKNDKMMIMRNGLVSDAPFTFNETNVSECSNYVYLCFVPTYSAPIPALAYTSEVCSFRKQEENAINIIERSVERVMLGVTPKYRLTRVEEGIRGSILCHRSKMPYLPRKVKLDVPDTDVF
ncbi:hypothetical protein RB195_011831 [Necator americanus]|uniref:Uncharacterized protein n=1 Tax=Necator americanus TaxID=51031 RepID=A0ABR1D474_NECAM